MIAKRAHLAVIALGFAVAASAFAAVADVIALPLLDDVTDVDALTRFDNLTGAGGLVWILAVIPTAVLFIRWFNLVHRSLDELCPGVRRHDTWWSIGGWFIPIMALFRPKQILDDMLVCANGEAAAKPWWASTWWALWIVASLVGNVAARALFGDATIEALRNATIADGLANAAFAAAGVVAIIVVRRTTAMIELKRGQVAAQAAVAAMGPQAAHELVGEAERW